MLKRYILLLLLIGTVSERGSDLLATSQQQAKFAEIKDTAKKRLTEKYKI